MQTISPILAPVLALIAWSLVMWIWMYATRLPAMQKQGMKPDSQAKRGEQMELLPPNVRWKADNYTHLMEQPTIFYALALTLALMGQDQGVDLILAWAYVGLRVVHSLIQAVFNQIELRFAVFVLASLMLFALTIRAGLVLLA